MIQDKDLIGQDRICSQELREYFKGKVGKGFHFIVPFQKWLKQNPDKTLAEACSAYRDISRMARQTRIPIENQFKYNIFVREQFDSDSKMTLKKAAMAWNRIKSSQDNL